jgi:hypothetical protein
MIELRLSRSLFMNFSFIRWNSGHNGAFSRIFLSYNGTQAITEPFTNFSFTRWNFARHIIWGKTLFIYITKSIYIRSTSLKTLPLDLGPPFARKRVRSFFILRKRRELNILVPESTYSFVVQVFTIL